MQAANVFLEMDLGLIGNSPTLSPAAGEKGRAQENSSGVGVASCTKLTSRMEPEELQKRMAELWARHLPEIAERVGVLERTCSALETGKLSEEERTAAIAAAHKLAGALGTFGRTRGTELAREVEGMLDGGSGDFVQIRTLVKELRRIIGG